MTIATMPPTTIKLTRTDKGYSCDLGNRVFEVERDQRGWLQRDPHDGTPSRWFASLDEVRRHLGMVMVGRLRFTRDTEATKALQAFRVWLLTHGARRCRGEVRDLLPGLTASFHDDCCDTLGFTYPEGEDCWSMYLRWRGEASDGE